MTIPSTAQAQPKLQGNTREIACASAALPQMPHPSSLHAPEFNSANSYRVF